MVSIIWVFLLNNFFRVINLLLTKPAQFWTFSMSISLYFLTFIVQIIISYIKGLRWSSCYNHLLLVMPASSIRFLILSFIQDSKMQCLLPLLASNLLSECEENWQISGFLHPAEMNPLDPAKWRWCYGKVKSVSSQVVHRIRAYLGFCGTKRIGVFILLPGWNWVVHRRITLPPSIKVTSTHLYTLNGV